MKRIIIIGEGQTEQEFCKDVLSPYFSSKGYLIQYPTIKKSFGGITSWAALKKQIENHLKQDKTAYVTTLIDFYGIKGNHKFPAWNAAIALPDKFQQLDTIENNMKMDIDPDLNFRFIPYIQLHEFEGLLFNTIDVFNNNFLPEEFINYQELLLIIESFPNPELINNGQKTAPSIRLQNLLSGYKKAVFGSCLAKEIGLFRIMAKSKRFNDWITKLESI